MTLIALALGYFVGGRWPDKAKRTVLALIIALSGLLTLLVPWLIEPILLATDDLGLSMGTFISTLILFSLSLFMLGMVGLLPLNWKLLVLKALPWCHYRLNLGYVYVNS